ncbi:MAG: glycosyltransferase family 8 protein [Ruminococcaceae bacterium]|nr:glycosyltransferase family 8 protein [Oscillospiraceae bacterium]
MNILYQCNDKYAPYCGTSITSLFENNKDVDNICVYILNDSISDINRNKFDILSKQYNRKIVLLDTTVIVSKMEELGIPKYRGSYTTNMKMFVSYVLPDDVDRLLYIDSDTIVLGDLSELFSCDMQEYPIAMALDFIVRNHKKTIGLSNNSYYYNAGVILFNCTNCKKIDFTGRIVNYINNNNPNFSLPDQDLLNIIFCDNIMQLDPKYNFQPVHILFNDRSYYKCFKNNGYYPQSKINKDKNDIRIAHFLRFLGEFPWDKNNSHPYNDLFDKYLKVSPWKNYEKAEKKLSVLFKIEKILYKILPNDIFIYIYRLSHEIFMKQSDKKSKKNKSNRLM